MTVELAVRTGSGMVVGLMVQTMTSRPWMTLAAHPDEPAGIANLIVSRAPSELAFRIAQGSVRTAGLGHAVVVFVLVTVTTVPLAARETEPAVPIPPSANINSDANPRRSPLAMV